MDNYILGVLGGAGLEVDGNTACGVINDMFVTVDTDGYRYAFVNFTFHTTPDTMELMRKIMSNISVKDYNLRITPYGASVKIKSATGGLFGSQRGMGDYISDLDRTVRLVPEQLAKNGIKGEGYCAVCGGELDANSKKYVRLPDMFTICYHSGCEQTLLDDMAHDTTKEGKKALTGNYGRTAIMAVLGVIMQFFFSWLLMAKSPVPYWVGSLVSAVAAFAMAYFFGGKMDKKAVLIVSIIAVVGAMAVYPILQLIVFKGIMATPVHMLITEAATFGINAALLLLFYLAQRKRINEVSDR